ncbi:MAG: DUF2306 domain-containing protein [Burkholderiales bacterium]|nr:DUF2306 domain-containing protein [Burkholderiales bacterium]
MNQEFTPVILIHLGAALFALALGAAVFLRRKGTPAHRLLGRTWVGLMLVTAISTYWIRSSGSFSWIHGLSVISLVALAFAMYFAVAGNIRRHQRIMKGVYFIALIVAGAFTLLPERLLGHALWSTLGVI